LNPRLLLDTHILVRWLSDFKKLSREQRRVIEVSLKRGECLGVSAMTLLEVVLLTYGRRITAGLDEFLDELDNNPAVRILPITTDVAREMGSLGDSLRDPGDRVIVATARIHRLRLLTADQRIIASNLVSVIE